MIHMTDRDTDRHIQGDEAFDQMTAQKAGASENGCDATGHLHSPSFKPIWASLEPRGDAPFAGVLSGKTGIGGYPRSDHDLSETPRGPG
jgi:hypothetical protein